MSTNAKETIIGVAAVIGVVILVLVIGYWITDAKRDDRDKRHEQRMALIDACKATAAYDDAQAECAEELAESIGQK